MSAYSDFFEELASKFPAAAKSVSDFSYDLSSEEKSGNVVISFWTTAGYFNTFFASAFRNSPVFKLYEAVDEELLRRQNGSSELLADYPSKIVNTLQDWAKMQSRYTDPIEAAGFTAAQFMPPAS